MIARGSSKHFARLGLSLILVSCHFIGVKGVSGADYMVYDDWGRTWCDAEKSPPGDDDDLMCWAAAASNILYWTRWGDPSQESFGYEDTIFSYFQDHWTNRGGASGYGWDWWFDGTDDSPADPQWSHPTGPGGGFWTPSYTFDDFYHSETNPSEAISFAKQYLQSGHGVTLGIYDPQFWVIPDGAHALTCWGIRTDEAGSPLGVFVTDSDDYLHQLAYYAVVQDSDTGRWFLQDYGGSDGWYVASAEALRLKIAMVDNGRVLDIDEDFPVFAELHVGQSGVGTVVQTDGTNVVRDDLILGHERTSTGHYDLSGTGTLNVDKDESIGRFGEGHLQQSGGMHAIGQSLGLGVAAGSRGTYELSADATLSVGSNEFVGLSGEGYFTQTGGTHTVDHTLYLGTNAGSSGTYDLFGGSLTVHDEVVGYAGEGYFTQHGGTHTIIGDLDIGVEPGSFGTYTHEGGTLSVGGATTVGPGGHFTMAGTIHSSAGVTNGGYFEWSKGYLEGNVSNESGSFTITSDSSKIMTQTAHLRNTATVTDSSTGLNFWSGSQISNLSGGLYDLQADGQYFGHMSDGGQIYNEGTFRKSAGAEESMIGPRVAFHNSGTLEVLSGTLAFGGGGSSEDAAIHLENGGRVRFSNEFDYGYTGNSSTVSLSGETAITGNGTVEMDGADLVVPSGHTATLRGSGDTHLDITGGFYDGRLMTDTGSTLTLDMGGDSNARLISGVVGGTGNVINTGNFEWSGGYINGDLTNVSPTFEVTGDGSKSIAGNGNLRNAGTVTHMGMGNMNLAGELDNLPGGVYDLQSDTQFRSGSTDPGQIDNAGTFRKSGGTGESVIGPYVAFHNSGTVEVLSGTLAFKGGFTQTNGAMRIDGGMITSTTPLDILGGSIEGTGEIFGDVFNEGGLTSPGFSPGILTINGDYTQGSDAALLLEIAGLAWGDYDIFNVTGTATLSGLLEIDFLDDFRPTLGDTFDFFNYGSCIGGFDSIYVRGFSDYGFIPTYGLTGLSLETGSVPAAVPLPSSLCLAAIGILTSLRCVRRRDHSSRAS